MERENIETKILMLREDAECCCVNLKTIYRKIKKGEILYLRSEIVDTKREY